MKKEAEGVVGVPLPCVKEEAEDVIGVPLLCVKEEAEAALADVEAEGAAVGVEPDCGCCAHCRPRWMYTGSDGVCSRTWGWWCQVRRMVL